MILKSAPTTFPITTTNVQFTDGPGKIHAISTGQVSVKRRFREAKGGPITAKLRFLLSKAFTEWMPIWVWVIEHPEGIFIVDTGENAQVTEPGYFRNENAFLRWVNNTQFRFQVLPEDEIGPQLDRIGIEQKEIRAVILTHLHLDHFDGLRHFEQTPIYVHRREWEKPSAALPSLYPSWFSPELIDLDQKELAGFASGKTLTKSGEIQLVSTPGHTWGHLSVLVQTKELHYFLAGDVSYHQEQLRLSQMAAANQSFQQARYSMIRIQSYSRSHPMVYLPSHDADCGIRLEQGSIFEMPA